MGSAFPSSLKKKNKGENWTGAILFFQTTSIPRAPTVHVLSASRQVAEEPVKNSEPRTERTWKVFPNKPTQERLHRLQKKHATRNSTIQAKSRTWKPNAAAGRQENRTRARGRESRYATSQPRAMFSVYTCETEVRFKAQPALIFFPVAVLPSRATLPHYMSAVPQHVLRLARQEGRAHRDGTQAQQVNALSFKAEGSGSNTKNKTRRLPTTSPPTRAHPHSKHTLKIPPRN